MVAAGEGKLVMVRRSKRHFDRDPDRSEKKSDLGCLKTDEDEQIVDELDRLNRSCGAELRGSRVGNTQSETVLISTSLAPPQFRQFHRFLLIISEIVALQCQQQAAPESNDM